MRRVFSKRANARYPKGVSDPYAGPMVSAVLFDFGGVILSSPFDAFDAYEQRVGLPRGFIRKVNSTDPDSNAWARFERSELDLDGFVRAFEAEAHALGHRVDGHAVLECLHGELRPAMVEAVRRCHEHFGTALVTNNVVSGNEAWSSGGSFAGLLEFFDVVVESSVVGCRKPEPRFYELALERLGIEPREAVLLDDLGINLKPARAMGMTTIKVTDPDVAIADLEAVVGIKLR